MKSSLENAKVHKVPFLHFKGSGFWILVHFNSEKMQKNQKWKFSASKCVTMADFTLAEDSNLISRKI